MYTCSSYSNPSDPSCLKCCNNCPINTPYVNCIMPRKQEPKTRNRHNLPLLLPLGLICHWINTNDDTRWQRTGWYHLSSRATKGASVYDMWLLQRTTVTDSATILQCVPLTGGRAGCETSEGALFLSESAVSSRLGLRCEGLNETVLMLDKIPVSPKRDSQFIWRILNFK